MSSAWSPDPLSQKTSFKSGSSALINEINTEAAAYVSVSNDTPEYARGVIGGTFNPITGRFTALRSGVYRFTGLLSFTAAGAHGALLRINGSATNAEILAQETFNAAAFRSFAVDVLLQAGEYVSIWSGALAAGNFQVIRFSGGAE